MKDEDKEEGLMPGPLTGKARADHLREVEADMRLFFRGGRERRGWASKLSITEMHGLMVRALEEVIGKDAEHARREGEALAEEYTQGWWTPGRAKSL